MLGFYNRYLFKYHQISYHWTGVENVTESCQVPSQKFSNKFFENRSPGIRVNDRSIFLFLLLLTLDLTFFQKVQTKHATNLNYISAQSQLSAFGTASVKIKERQIESNNIAKYIGCYFKFDADSTYSFKASAITTCHIYIAALIDPN